MEKEITVGNTGLRYGVILGLVLILFTIIAQMAGLSTNRAVGFIPLVFIIGALVLGHNYYKAGNQGFMSYGKSLGISALILLVGITLSSVFFYVYVSVIDPSVIDMIKEAQLEAWEKQGMSDEQIDQAQEFSGFMTTPIGLALTSLVSNFFLGFILALIVGAITQKKNPTLDF